VQHDCERYKPSKASRLLGAANTKLFPSNLASKNMETVHEAKWATVQYDPQLNAIIVVWQGFVNMEGFKETMMAALDAFYDKDALYWLIDQTERQAIHPTINEWVVESFYPLLIDAAKAKSKMAVIVSKDVFGRFSMRNQTDSLLSKYDKQMIPYQYFKTQDEATQWLQA
jgi:hypothetical protein